MTAKLATLIAVLTGLLVPTGVVGPAGAAPCPRPAFVTSDEDGMWSSGGYIVHNNMWNVSSYDVSETLAACSYRNWRVTATADDASGDGAVKTYPNVHLDYHDWATGAEPRLSSFATIRSTFAARTPHVGIYDAAYDIWLDGVPGEHEVMIWTDNFHQVPSGSLIATRSFSGHRWRVYATPDDAYVAFVPTRRLTHGTLGLKRMLAWLVARGRLSSDVTLGQICFGFEVVSTGGGPATFKVNDFSITSSRN
jgi:Glycosyl hydrolase family 12